MGCLGLLGCTRETTVGVESQSAGEASDVAVGTGIQDVVAAKGKPLSVISSGDQMIVRWSDVIVRFERQMVTRIELRDHAREEAERVRCEKAVVELRARQAVEATRADELRRQAARENEAYVQNLELERKQEAILALQEDARMRQSSFGPMPTVSISCPSQIQERIGLSFSTASFSRSAFLPGPDMAAKHPSLLAALTASHSRRR